LQEISIGSSMSQAISKIFGSFLALLPTDRYAQLRATTRGKVAKSAP
jgi:hypothetical protein